MDTVSSDSAPSEIEPHDAVAALGEVIQGASEIDHGNYVDMLETARSGLGERAPKFGRMALGDDQSVDCESRCSAQNGADIMWIGDLVERQHDPAVLGYLADIKIRQGPRLQQHSLMHGLLAEPPRQFPRVDNARGQSRRRRSGGNAWQRVFSRMQRQQLSPARNERFAHGVGAIQQRDIGRSSLKPL